MKIENRMAYLASAGGFLDGYSIVMLAASIGLISTYFGITSAGVKGLLIGFVFLGGFFGAIFSGRLVDRYGRRIIFITDLIFFVGGALLSAFSINLIEIFIGRFMTGFAIGMDLAVGNVMVSEFSPRKKRGFLLTMSGPTVPWSIGAAGSYLVTIALLPFAPLTWRFVFLVSVIPAVIVLVLRRDIPESPRWLSSKQRISDAKKVISDFNVEGLSAEGVEMIASKGNGKFTDLFRKPFAKFTTGVMTLKALVLFVLIPINFFTPIILTQIGFARNEVLSLTGGAVVWLFQLAGYFVAAFVIDKVGRRLLAGVGVVTFLTVYGVLSFVHIPVNSTAALWFGLSFVIGVVNSSAWIWCSEFFPTSLRGSAMGLTSSVDRMTGFLGSYITSFLLVFGVAVIYKVSLIVSIIILVVILTLITAETSNKSLEEIAEEKEGKVTT